MKRYFITATDTEMGKTTVSTMLLQSLSQQGLKTAGFKPIASGSQQTKAGLRNDDALALINAMSMRIPYDVVNPFTFEPAIAPDIAAQHINVELSVTKLIEKTNNIAQYNPDVLIIEGAGGWSVPLNAQETMADYVRELQVPVILVVGIKLGCINHAILTVQSIKSANLPFAGWIANCIDQHVAEKDNIINRLETHLGTPCKTVIAYNQQNKTVHDLTI